MDSTAVVDRSSPCIKDFKLSMEYKYLVKQAPAGVYLLPERTCMRKLHGVIFVRRGVYRDGVFRFVLELPDQYNDYNAHPVVRFTSTMFHPLVDASSGNLDLKVEDSLKNWNPDKHFIATVLTFVKKIFYLKSFESYSSLSAFPNQEAASLFEVDKDEFVRRVNVTVVESLDKAYDPQPEGNSLVFSEPKPAHEDVIRRVLCRQPM